jgi:Glycosyl transferase family 2
MILGLTSIQRNRGPWLLEWFAFHYVVGFRKFYFYAHMCDDNTAEIITRLKSRLDITAFFLPEKADQIQLSAYQHTCENYMQEVDWMCFLDGDEFIFPTQANTMQEALWPYDQQPLSAIGVYNVNFGSAGHISEPQGLITENFKRRADINGFLSNRRVKSIVKGRQTVSITSCSHVFNTPHGTIDELKRPVTWGYLPDYVASYEQFRVNHYVCQSREYYEKFKRKSGHADSGADNERDEAWWKRFDTNDEHDDYIMRFNDRLHSTIAEFKAAMALV